MWRAAPRSDQSPEYPVVASCHVDVCSHQLAPPCDEHVQLVDTWTVRREALWFSEVCCLLGRHRHCRFAGNVLYVAAFTGAGNLWILYLQSRGRTCSRRIRSVVWVDWCSLRIWYQVPA